MPGPLGGQRRGAAEPLLERRQPIPGLLRAGDQRGVGRDRLLELGLARPRLLDCGLDLARRARIASSSATSRSSCAAQREQVVGQQPQPRVAQLGLHAGGPAGDLGLLAQRLELAAQLAGEVGQAG